MIIVGVKLFQRGEETMGLTFENLDLGLSVMRNGLVRGIAVTFQGKNDAVPVTLVLWADDTNPEFCPVLHLLVYLYLLGHESGYLFPNYNCMKNILQGRTKNVSLLMMA
jgi:hypothetical protein